MKKAKYVCFHHRSCCFPLSLDKRHLGTVPRFWKQWLSGQEPRSLKCAFFFCSFLPVSLLSLIITSVLGPMPNSSALTPQYTQAHTAEQFAVQRIQCRHVFPNQAPANHFCLQEEPLGLRMLLVSCAQLTRDTPFLHFPEKRVCGAPSWVLKIQNRAGKQTSLKMIPSQTLILQTHTGLMLSTWTVPDDFSRATRMLTVQRICQIRAFTSNCKIKGKSPSSINCNELLLAAQFKIAAGQIRGRPLGIKWCGLVATEPGNTFSWINCHASHKKH